MRRLLLDANLSPRNSAYLRATFGFDAVDQMSLGLNHLDDTDVIELAKREGRIVVTEDLDFGKLYHRYARGQVGVIILRQRVQSVASANRLLGRFFVDEARVRITTEQ